MVTARRTRRRDGVYMINQGDVLLARGSLDGWKTLLTYVVPYVVSTYGAVSYRINMAGKGDRP